MNPSQTNSPDTAMKPLHPVLQAAIASLDVELEAELMRYRRSRHGQPPVTSIAVNVPSHSAKSRSLDLIDLPAATATPTATTHSTSDSTSNSTSSSTSEVSATPSPAMAGTAPSTAIPPLFSESDHPGPAVHAKAALMVQQPSPDTTATASAAIAPGQGTVDPKTGYLASSAQLLHELAQAEAQAEKVAERSTTSFAQQIFTPLGVGSMLLLLVSSIALGYAIANPGAIAHLETAFGRSSTAERDPADMASDGLGSEPLQRSGNLDLATEEFVDLDLGTLSTLPGTGTPPSLAGDNTNPANTNSANTNSANTTGTPSPLVTPNTTTPGTSGVFSGVQEDTGTAVATQQAASQSTVPRPAPLPQSQATVETPPPTPNSVPSVTAPSEPTAVESAAAIATAPTTPAPVAPAVDNAEDAERATTNTTEPLAAANDYFYVVVDYEGDPSLATAQTAVNDAYVRNFEDGARIQMGAFNDAESAAELVDRLQTQGITAEVKTP